MPGPGHKAFSNDGKGKGSEQGSFDFKKPRPSQQEKKAKRHVYSSGLAGCGGKAETTNAKNTGQPLPCPFCERIFKQDGRLKEHIRSKHSQEEEGEQEGRVAKQGDAMEQSGMGVVGASTNQGTQPAVSGVASGSQYFVKTPKMLLSEWCQKQKRPATKYKAMPVGTAASTASSTAASTSTGASTSRPCFHCRIIFPDPKADASKDVILWYRGMEAGSASEAENRAAVVGMHHFMGERRMDLLLPPEFRPQWTLLGHQAVEIAEAQKRKEEREGRERARRDRDRGREVAAKDRTPQVYLTEGQREEVAQLLGLGTGTGGGRDGSNEQGKRGGWDTGLAVGRLDKLSSIGGGGALPSAASTRHQERHGSIAVDSSASRARLLQHGFPAQAVEDAMKAASSSSSPSSNLYDESLRWLLLHLPESQLPHRFAPESSKAHLKVLYSTSNSTKDSVSNSNSRGTVPSTVEEEEENRTAEWEGLGLSRADLQQVLSCGYTLGEVREAVSALQQCLREAEGVPEPLWPSLLLWLFKSVFLEPTSETGAGEEGHGPALPLPDSQMGGSGGDGIEEAWSNEVMAMEAIFGEGFTVSVDQVLLPSVFRSKDSRLEEPKANHVAATMLRVDLVSIVPELPLDLRLMLFLPPGPPPPLPYLALSCPSSSSPVLRSLTQQTLEQAREYTNSFGGLGETGVVGVGGMLHSLAMWVAENFESACAAAARTAQDSSGLRSERSGVVQAWDNAIRGMEAANPTAGGLPQQTSGSPEAGQEAAVIVNKVEALGVKGREREHESKERGGKREREKHRESQRLLADWHRWQRDPKGRKMMEGRGKLPAFQRRGEVLECVRRGRVTVVIGATGCGKSTQVPQYILEDAIEQSRGAECRILCTQPRRVAATGLAQRVAEERGERVGETVGYSVRLDSRQGPRTRILFCTVGVLLRRLMDDRNLTGEWGTETGQPKSGAGSKGGPVTHVIVDEVHERSLDTDFLLLLLKETVARHPDLKVVLMSATVEASTFTSYFQGKAASGPSLGVPEPQLSPPSEVQLIELQGFCHPVRELFLEDVLELTGMSMAKKKKGVARERMAPSASLTKATLGRVKGGGGDMGGGASHGAGSASSSLEGGMLSRGTCCVPRKLAPWDEDEDGDEFERNGEEREEKEDWEEREADLGPGLPPVSGEGRTAAAANHQPISGTGQLHGPAQKQLQGLSLSGGQADPRYTTTSYSESTKADPERATQHSEITEADLRYTTQYSGSTKADPRYTTGQSLALYSESTLKSLENADEESISYPLLAAVVRHLVHWRHEEAEGPTASARKRVLQGYLRELSTLSSDDTPSGVLVFLPGVAEISRAQRELEQRAEDASLMQVVPLHSGLSPEEQQRVFLRPPKGKWKVVLATNIAETSITIDDVICVIDTGRRRSMQQDPARDMPALTEGWVSLAEAGQRKGRAGRVRPGVCIRMFSRRTAGTLPAQQQPEIMRVGLEELCLQMKAAFPADTLHQQLSLALTPPPWDALSKAISNLQRMSALSQNESLTPLGGHLARLPMPPKVGKMLLYGVLLKCVDPILTVAAALTNTKPVFIAPPPVSDARQLALEAKARFSCGSRSDHIAVAHAFAEFLDVKRGGGFGAARKFCSQKFLSFEAMRSVEASRSEYSRLLVSMGFLSSDDLERFRRAGRCEMDAKMSLGVSETEGDLLNSNSGKWRIVKSAICAGFYPNVVRVQLPQKRYTKTEHGAVEKEGDAKGVRYYVENHARVFMHPSSVNFSNARYESPWVVYSERVQTSKDFLRECSEVPSLALLLLGGDVQVDAEKGTCTVDGWMGFAAPGRVAMLVQELRAQVDSLLTSKLERPGFDLLSCPTVDGMCRLLE